MATRPTSIEVRTASRTPGLSQTLSHQCNVNSLGGQAKTLLALKELMTMTPSGM